MRRAIPPARLTVGTLVLMASVAALAHAAGGDAAPKPPKKATPAMHSDDDRALVEVVREGTPAPMHVLDTGDLGAIRARGTLRILVFGEGELLLPRSGPSTMTDRDLAAGLARSLGVAPVIVPVARSDDLIPALLEGRGDIIAARLAQTGARQQRVAFSRPTAVVDELLVARAGAAGLPTAAEALSGQTITVRPSSSYRETLDGLVARGIRVQRADAQESTETQTLVEQVGKGSVAMTVVDSDLYEHIRAYVPDVQALFPLRTGREIGLGIRPTNPDLKAAADAFLVQAAMTSHARKLEVGDLPALRRRGSLRMITRNGPSTYFLHKGEQRGYDYEITLLAAEEMGLRLEVVVAEHEATMVRWLLEGRGDVIAAQLAPTAALRAQVAVSRPYIGRLSGDDVVPEQEGAAVGVWAVRPDSRLLLGALNKFMALSYRGLDHNLLRKRYFVAGHARPAPALQAGASAISPYDALFRRRARQYGLDWRLLAAQAFQESGFDPAVVSGVGAEGLLQVMPATGREMGFTKLHDPDEGTHAGVRYLARLIDQFEPTLPFKHRVRFALASYNAGKGHVDDARRLAAELGLNPNKWFNHVEKAMLLLADPRHARRARHGWCRGEEPVRYVSEIQSRYERYLSAMPDL